MNIPFSFHDLNYCYYRIEPSELVERNGKLDYSWGSRSLQNGIVDPFEGPVVDRVGHEEGGVRLFQESVDGVRVEDVRVEPGVLWSGLKWMIEWMNELQLELRLKLDSQEQEQLRFFPKHLLQCFAPQMAWLGLL